MAYQLSEKAFDAWLEELWNLGEVMGPTLFKNKGAFSDTDKVSYGEIRKRSDLILDKKSYLSPKEAAFPTRETLFYFGPDSVTVPEVSDKPIYVFLRPCDINGFNRLDNIFLNNGPHKDPYYQKRKNRLRYILIGCPEKGFDSCFCVSMGTNATSEWHASLSWSETGAVLTLNSNNEYFEFTEELKSSLQKFINLDNENNITETDDQTPVFVTENKTKVDLESVEGLRNEAFDHPLWQEYTARCIACGRCNTSCITCSCFTMQDVKHGQDMGERRRRWASCHVKGYTDMAGGHSFRSKNGERMRFKTMHKVNDYKRRFGVHMCVGCGRCDDVCPEYISFSKCINKLGEIMKEQEE